MTSTPSTPSRPAPPGHHRIDLTVDGEVREVEVDVRSTLLDTLRERLGVTTVKKGCDHGQCGSCTVLLQGRRHLTCLSLAVQHDGADVVTAAGLAAATGQGEDGLHPVQQAFLERDAYQCGYCTPGQVCSAVGMLEELAQGHPSHVTDDLDAEVGLDHPRLDDELRERMSGNLCRCGAYVNIVAAIRDAAGVGPDDPDDPVGATRAEQEDAR